MASRADVYRALFERLRAVPGVKRCERRLVLWDEVPPTDQPALFMAIGTQTVTQTRGRPPMWTLEAPVFLYARRDTTNDAQTDPGGDTLADLVDAIGTRLRRQPDESPGVFPGGDPTTPEVTTLGGRVSWARVEGQVVTDEGYEGEQAVARLTIAMGWVQD